MLVDEPLPSVDREDAALPGDAVISRRFLSLSSRFRPQVLRQKTIALVSYCNRSAMAAQVPQKLPIVAPVRIATARGPRTFFS
jgi:hypothetical protein